MKRLMLFTCCLTLIAVLAASPFAVSAQGPGEEDYTPLIFGDHIFSLLYPSKWTFDSEHEADGAFFVFASDPSILTRPTAQAYAPGEFAVALSLLFAAQPVGSDAELEAILTQILQNELEGNDGDAFGPSFVSLMAPSEGLSTIARATMVSSDLGDGTIYLWTIGDRLLGIVLVQTATGEMTLQEPDVLTFIQSVSLNGTLDDLVMAVEQAGGGS